jgi:hypothetical protein
MSDGNLAGITGQWGECKIGSFKILDKSGKSKVAKKETVYSLEDTGDFGEEVPSVYQ